MPNIDQIPTNPAVLLWARESLALSRNQAAEKSGIPDHRLAQLERGERSVTIEELHCLSKAYKRTIATLLLAEPPKEKPLPTDRRTVNSKELGNFNLKTIMAVRKARAFTQSYIELKNELNIAIPRLDITATLQEEPLTIARTIRKRLDIDRVREEVKNATDDLALDAYIEKVESLGIAVFQISLTDDDTHRVGLSGFSIVDDTIPIIGIKRGDVPTRKNFTLFHELGHILLRDGGSCDLSEGSYPRIEKWCNAFAAEVLIPSEALLAEPLVREQRARNEMTWRHTDLITIGKTFHVGPLAVLRSLLENGLTTPEFYSEKHPLWNKPAFGRSKHPEGPNKPKQTLKEKGRTYVSLAFQAFDQNRINLKDLADFLGIKLSYIPKTRQLLNA